MGIIVHPAGRFRRKCAKSVLDVCTRAVTCDHRRVESRHRNLFCLFPGSGLQKYHVHASSNPRQELWKLPVEGQPPAQEIESPFKARQVRKMLYRGLGDAAAAAALSGAGRKPESSLTVSEIKQLLEAGGGEEAGGVDYRDCFEKRELVDRLVSARDKLPQNVKNQLEALLSSQAALADAGAEGPFDRLFMDEQNTVNLFKRCAPTVVQVTTSNVRQGIFTLDLDEIPRGTGSGFVWDLDGHIVTNYHVITGAQRAKIGLKDGRSYDATLVGAYPDSDIAVLKINVPASDGPIVPISVGSSANLQVGQKCFAIGNPFGLDQSLSSGIISGLGRDMKSISGRQIRGVVQTDAAINPGNSGGPLLDSRGNLVGVNTMIYSPSGASSGVGFAVPSDAVRRIVNEIIKNKRVQRAGLGVYCASDSQTRNLGLRGALILSMNEGGAAARANLRSTARDWKGNIVLGDVIVAVDDQKVGTVEDLQAAIEGYSVGDDVKITILRGNKQARVSVKLQEIKG
eukprot:CAMPEP_0114287684 /NCGR_PEP_ID=MMETSP0059-20121206/6409_1 /TAXON_ID=36894 /ORGANISM="Pyramimonas parkeae, Strain CCMP726" /LENGTH=512 /DNA_ID=CAMNT_0001408781 /DNA_START=246 /DNA_END=1785 /DNA_ORIENTATION=+